MTAIKSSRVLGGIFSIWRPTLGELRMGYTGRHDLIALLQRRDHWGVAGVFLWSVEFDPLNRELHV